jgi:hypothetical protein
MNLFYSLLILFAGSALAIDSDGCAETASSAAVPGGGSDDITITVLNTWQPSYAQQILDLEWRSSDQTLLFISSVDNKIFIADPDDGAYVGEVARPAGLVGFGIAWDGTEYYINAWNDGQIYHSDGGGTWTPFANPAATGGRGLQYYDFTGVCMYEAYSSDPVFQAMEFDPDGTGLTAYDLAGIPGQISGITGHEMMTTSGMTPYGLIATCYNYPSFYFYHFTGSGFTQYDTAPCPVAVTKSLGLTFTDYTRGTFFWSYQGTDGFYYVSELLIPVLGALEEDTWGAIKSQF